MAKQQQPPKVYKRDSNEVDKLYAKVEDLVNNKGWSINKACKEVGLQNTVYYFRKRKEKAIEDMQQHSKPQQRGSIAVRKSSVENVPSDLEELKREYTQTKERLEALKEKILEATLTDLNR